MGSEPERLAFGTIEAFIVITQEHAMITKPDPAFADLSHNLLELVEDQLSNNESDSDDDLYEYFVACGLSSEQAERDTAKRCRSRRPWRSPTSLSDDVIL